MFFVFKHILVSCTFLKKDYFYVDLFFFCIRNFIYENYKNLIFCRFTLSNNLSLSIFSNKFFTWYECNQYKYSIFSVVARFDSNLSNSNVEPNSFKKLLLFRVFLKKKFGFFKKKVKTNHVHLYRLSFLKNLYINRFNFKKTFLSKRKSKGSKFLELKSTSFRLFLQNRKILGNLFFLKNTKQYKTTKVFSKLIKSDIKVFSKFFEFSLLNFLVKVKFCYTFSEAFCLINKGMVFVNGTKVSNPYFQLNLGDVVQLILLDNFFTFFKMNTQKKIKLLNSLKHIIWKNNRFKNNFYKQQYNRVPDWVSSLSFFYDDCPAFVEIDYTISSFCVIDIGRKLDFFKKTNLRFINLFMLRNYNWNYLT